jgi:hypothetical protein
VENLDSFIKDANDFIEKVKTIDKVPNNAFLVTIDAASLYTNIPTTGGISAMEHFLEKRPVGSLPNTAFLVELASKILLKNNFQFMGQNYMQISGTAMGTTFAPEYTQTATWKNKNNHFCKHKQKSLSHGLVLLITFS